ncbi:protein of unknown function [Rhizobiales bacterium GAS191]|nr:protein of unknown function [Rhizobiales bacterium GAS113]SEE00438.1 protein of unknown function [Rhizobiales bacterium GAS191]
MRIYRNLVLKPSILLRLSVLALASGLSVARANDSIAELATGGLVLTRSADIEMRSEDLYVSTREIRVTYHFFNTGPQDKTVTVAFPMPDITVKGPDDNISVPTENPENFLDFSTRADGRPVTTRVEQKVFAKGVDRTAELRKLGVPLQPALKATNDALDQVSHAQWGELSFMGLTDTEEFDDGSGVLIHLRPRWTLKTTYYFEQSFPAGREVVIEHRYKPSVGYSAGTALGSRQAAKESWYKEYQRKYCMDASFFGAIERAKLVAKSDFPPLEEQRLAYILTTGGNWAGPIRSFRLVVDKGDPQNLVSLCGDGVKKIAPTQFEIRKSDFIPTRDLDVLILTEHPQQ